MHETKSHWEQIYLTTSHRELSWTQVRPSPSIDWILEAVPARTSAIIDVGGGVSNLIDQLILEGYDWPAVLDVSETALEIARERLGNFAAQVEWLTADVTDCDFRRKYDLWHDRAVFHFLTTRSDRVAYLASLKKALVAGGKALIATFSPQGPSKCSGLDVVRFDEKVLSLELGDDFRLLRHERHQHTTPRGATQEFQYCLFQLVE